MARKMVVVGLAFYATLTLLLFLVIAKISFEDRIDPTNSNEFRLQATKYQRNKHWQWWDQGGYKTFNVSEDDSMFQSDASQIREEDLDTLEDRPSNSSSEGEWGTQPPVFVLLVAPSHRSGSSYLGELLSSHRSSVYFFEPLWYFPTHEKTHNADPERLREVLQNLFTCRLTSVRYIFPDQRTLKFILRRPRGLNTLEDLEVTRRICEASPFRVAKVVRARLRQVLPLLDPATWTSYLSQEEELPSQTPSFKLVYLMRDPRAILMSVLEREHDFSPRRKDPGVLCDALEDDLKALKELAKHHQHVTAIRYEDLVADAVGSTQRLFRFMGIPLSPEVYEFLLDHQKEGPPPDHTTTPSLPPSSSSSPDSLPRKILNTRKGKRLGKYLVLYKDKIYRDIRYLNKRKRKKSESGYTYYSTYKRPNRPFDRWKTHLNREIKTQVERACRDVLYEFGYK